MFLEKLIAGVALFAAVSSSVAQAGTWVSGGGQTVTDSRGQLRFLDLVPASELPFVRAVTGLPTYAVCTTKPFERMTLPDVAVRTVIAGWSNKLPALALVLSEQWELLKYKTFAANIDLGSEFRDSQRVDVQMQHTVGAFSDGLLVIDNRAFGRLSLQDQSGFLVHELLRQVAIMFDTNSTLIDIEEMTPAIVQNRVSGKLQELERLINPYYVTFATVDQLEKMLPTLSSGRATPSDFRTFARLAKALVTSSNGTPYVSHDLWSRLSALESALYGLDFLEVTDTLKKDSARAFVDARIDISNAESDLGSRILGRGIFYQARVNTIPAEMALEAMESNARRGYAYNTRTREWVQNCR